MRRCGQVMGKRSVAQCGGGGGGKRQASNRREAARLQDQRKSLYAWNSLNIGAAELRCELTLTTGQTFRWRLIAPNMYDNFRSIELQRYLGVLKDKVILLRQKPDDVEYVALGNQINNAGSLLREYFNADVNLRDLWRNFCQRDAYFNSISNFFQGARMLRQDPCECLFSFICSSNNNILRIQGMVERLCTRYGQRLAFSERDRDFVNRVCQEALAGEPEIIPRSGKRGPNALPSQRPFSDVPDNFYAFPTVTTLATSPNVENVLREEGFGYRAKFIAQAAAQLAKKEGGAEAFLLNLREVQSAQTALEELQELSGVGPKVAACIALFSLDKHNIVPVDVHVWRIAREKYAPDLKSYKSLTANAIQEVNQTFEKVFGSYAGWAHNALFISQLSHLKNRIPSHLHISSSKSAKKTSSDS